MGDPNDPRFTNPNDPGYQGPGYVYEPARGWGLPVANVAINQAWWAEQRNKLELAANQASVPSLGDAPAPVDTNIIQPPSPFVPPSRDVSQQRPIIASPIAGRGLDASALFDDGGMRPASPIDAGAVKAAIAGMGAAPPPDPGTTPAEVDRERIDQLLRSVNSATSGLLGIANTRDQFSQAQAQLAISTEDAQRAALGRARSGSRRDRSMLERQAIAEGATLASDQGRSAALLRGQEEEATQKLRLDAFKAAGDLGLNAAALEVDVNQLDMNAATNYLNQVFETNRLGLTIDQAEAQRITNFTRDMALIAKDYYALSLQERQSIRDDLTRRHGISEQSRIAIEQLDAQPGFFEQAALGLLAAAPGVIATVATGGAAAPLAAAGTAALVAGATS